MRKGLVQIYTGNGKGKTTAALGLALRASGAGLRVCILQFIKKRSYSEIKALRTVKNVKLEQCGRGCFIRGKPGAQDIECARQGLAKAEKAIRSRRFDVVILDEVNIALKLGLVNTRDIVGLVKRKPVSVELVLTGRGCPPSLFKHAQLVTEMREIKHPYQRGLKARPGIEY